ncbi:hypothetical protein F4780DRAFT_653450 [Xylariomycetidae sp. FL0641]|nr:hypothetical protein F4780DRAFT_653450 [Xylariomycetidae sp. FL0641]
MSTWETRRRSALAAIPYHVDMRAIALVMLPWDTLVPKQAHAYAQRHALGTVEGDTSMLYISSGNAALNKRFSGCHVLATSRLYETQRPGRTRSFQLQGRRRQNRGSVDHASLLGISDDPRTMVCLNENRFFYDPAGLYSADFRDRYEASSGLSSNMPVKIQHSGGTIVPCAMLSVEWLGRSSDMSLAQCPSRGPVHHSLLPRASRGLAMSSLAI